MPLRPMEKGRQRLGVITRSPSQARIVALITQASVPPTIALSTMPQRIICRPMPTDWLAEEQALPTAKVGPSAENRAPSVVGMALGMSLGTLNVSGRVFST